MKLNFLKEVPLETLRKNISINLEHYFSDSNEWIFEFFENENPFLHLKHEVYDFELNTSDRKPEKTDMENIKIFYSALKSLTAVEASNENLWSGLSHSTFWNYVRYRTTLNDSTVSIENVSRSFFFTQGRKRSLIIHPLARLWWAGHLVYDEKRENPFELLDVFTVDFQTKLLYLFSSNFSNNPKITKAFLSAVHDFEKNGIKINRKIYNEVIMYLNILGGTYVLDYFEQEELKDKIVKKIDTLLYNE